jgi:transposase
MQFRISGASTRRCGGSIMPLSTNVVSACQPSFWDLHRRQSSHCAGRDQPARRKRTKHAKSWLDAAIGELLRQVEYKARWNSKHFVQVDRFFPSTKLCSACGYQNDDLSLSEREWTCPGCRMHHLRDWNAAKSVRAEGLRVVRGTPGDGKRLWTASQPGVCQHCRLNQE